MAKIIANVKFVDKILKIVKKNLRSETIDNQIFIETFTRT